MAGARCPECGADVFEMPSELTSALEGHRGGAHDLKPQVASGAAKAPKETAKLQVGTRSLAFDDFDELLGAWVPLTVALNSFNRAMGLQDLYPFVLAEAAMKKIRFVHDVIEQVHLPARKAA